MAPFTLHVVGIHEFVSAIFMWFCEFPIEQSIHFNICHPNKAPAPFLGDKLHTIFKVLFCYDCRLILSCDNHRKIAPRLGCHLVWMAPKRELQVLHWLPHDLESKAELWQFQIRKCEWSRHVTFLPYINRFVSSQSGPCTSYLFGRAK